MFGEALEKYNQALTKDPKDIEALSRKGAALAKLGRFKGALAAYDKVLAIDPNHPVTYKKVLILFSLGKYKEALDIHEQFRF
jgi:Flp pilus assembly protein TadD